MTSRHRIVTGIEHRHSVALVMALVAALVTGRSQADTIYWNGEGLPWSATTSWSTDGTATTPNPAAIPGILDDVVFGIDGIATPQTVYLDGNQSALSLLFRATTASTLVGGTDQAAADNTLTIGTGGITVDAAAGAVTIGQAATPGQVAVVLGGTQSWTNNSSNLLSVLNGITGTAGAAATQTLTIAGSGDTILGGILGNGAAGGTLALAKTGAGTLTLSGANIFTGGISISGGTVVATAPSALGSGTIGLSTTSGAGRLEIQSDTGFSLANTIGSSSTNAGTLVVNRSTAGSGAGLTYAFTAPMLIAGNVFTFTTGSNITSGLPTVQLGGANLTAGGSGTATFNPTGVALSITGPVNIGTNNVAKTLGLGGTTTGNAISGVISNNLNTLSLAKSGTSTWTLTAANTFTGNTTITGGTLAIGGAGSLGSGTYTGTIANDGLLLLSTSVSQALNGTISGGGTIVKQNATTTLTLGGTNTFTGGVTVSAGTVRLNANAGAGTGTITLGDADTGSANVALLINNNSDPNNNIVVSALGTGTVTIGSDGGGAGANPTLFGGTLTLNRATTLQGSSTDRTTYTGRITGNVGTLTIAGARTTIDSTANDFVGNIVINSGATLQVNANGVIPDASAVTTSGLLSLNTATETIGSLAGGGTVSAITAGARALVIGANNTSTTFSGIISNNAGTVAIGKTGTGTLTLTGANTYTGATTIDGGTLAIGTGGALSATTAVAINNGGTLRLDRFDTWGNHNITASAPITVAAGGTLASNNSFTTIVNPTLNGGQVLLNGGANANFPAFAFKGTLTAGGSAASSINVGTGSFNAINIGPTNAAGVLTVAVADATASTAADLTLNSVLQNAQNTAGNGTLVSGLTKTGVGTLLLTAANTYTGTTSINAGVLALSGVGRPGAAGVAPLTMGGGGFDLGGGSASVGAVSITTAGSTIFNGDLTGTSYAASNTTGNAIVSANLLGTGTLTKTGAGVLTLSGTNSFQGLTTVSGGVLTINDVASLPGWNVDGAWTVAAGAGLAIGNAVTEQQGATLRGTTNYQPGALFGFDTTAGDRTVSGVYGDGPNGALGLAKVGGNVLYLTGSQSNTFTGKTLLAGEGTSMLGLAKTGGAIAVPGDMELAATATRAVLFATENNQFGPTSVLRFTNTVDNRFELKGTTQTVAGLTGNSGNLFIQHSEFSPGANVGGLSRLVLNVAEGQSFTYTSGVIRNQGGLVGLAKAGAGTQTLVGTGITYGGPTTVTGGTLVLQDTTGFASPTLVTSGGMLSTTGTAGDDVPTPLTLAAGTYRHATTAANAFRVWQTQFIVGAGGGTLDIANTNTTNNNVFLDGGIFGTAPLVMNTTGGGNNGIVFRSAMGRYTGPFTVNSGNVFVNTGAGRVLEASDLTLGAGGVLRLDANWAAAATNGVVKSLSGTGGVTLGAQTLTVGSTNGSGTFGGIIAGTGGLTKVGTGTQVLTGANTYTGATTLSNGVLQVGNGTTGSLATTAVTFTGPGTLRLQRPAGTATSFGALTLTGGDGRIESVYPGSGTSSVAFSSLAARTAGGGTMDFRPTGGTAGSTNSIALTGAATGFMGPAYTVGGGAYAWYDAGGYVRAYGATDTNAVTPAGGTTFGTVTASSNVTPTGAITAQTSTTINTLRLSNQFSGAPTVAITASNTLSVAGILKSGGVAGTISGGTVQPATAGGELIVRSDLAADTLTISSVIGNNTSAGILTKTGAGTLVLSGANTYTGGTVINGGTLQIGALVDATGPSQLGLSGTLTFNGGTLAYTGASGSTARAIQVNSASTIDMRPGSALSLTGAWSGTGGLTKAGNGTLTVTNNGLANHFRVGTDAGGDFLMTAGTLNISPGQYFVMSQNGVTSSFTQTGGVVNFTAANGSYIGNNSAAAVYSASLIISGGTFNQPLEMMRVGQGGNSRGLLQIGGGPGPAVANVNRVQLGSSQGSSTGTLELLTGGTLVTTEISKGAGAATMYFDGGTFRASASNTYLTNVNTYIRSGGATIDDGGFTATISQNLLSDGGTGGLVKLGSGVLRLTGTSGYLGNTTISAGTLAIGSINALPGWNQTGRWTVAPGAALAIGNSVSEAEMAVLLASPNLPVNPTFGFDTQAGDRTWSSVIADPVGETLSLVKVGNNTLTLSGANTYTGPTVVAAGTLRPAAPSALSNGDTAAWTAANLTFRSGATLLLPVGPTEFGSSDVTTLITNLSAVDGNGLQAGSQLGFDTTNATGGNFTLPLPITNSTGTGGGAVGLVKLGAGTLTLSGTNTYTGATTVNAGTLTLATGATLTASGALALNNGSRFDLGGNAATVGAVTIPAAPASGDALANGSLTAASLAVSNATGTVGISANVTSTGGVTKTAAGTLRLTGGTSAVGGTISVQGGSFVVAGVTLTNTANNTLSLTTATTTIESGLLSVGRVVTGDGSGAQSVVNVTGGTLRITGANNANSTASSFLLGHWGASNASSTFTQSAGLVESRSAMMSLGWDSTAGSTVTVSGGTMSLLGINFANTRNNLATFNLNGGRLNLGASGMTGNASAKTMNLGVATVGAMADWTGAQNLVLTNAATGVTFDTTDVANGLARTVTLSGVVSGSGRLNVGGTGTVVLSGVNTYTGTTVVSGGALRLAGATSLPGGIGATGGTSALTLSGGVLDLANADFLRPLGTTAADVQFTGAGGFAATGAARTVNLGGAGAQVTWGTGSFVPDAAALLLGHTLANNTVTFANPIALGASNRTVQVARGTGSLDGILGGVVSGDGGLVKTGAGILSLGAANTYAGNTAVNAGVLSVPVTANLPGWNTNGRWSVASGAALAVGTGLSDADLATMLGTTNFASGGSVGFDTTAGDRTYASTLADTAQGGLGLVKVGAGTLTLSAANTYTGPTRVLAGTLALASQNALQSSTLDLATGSIVFSSAVGGNAFTAGGLAGPGPLVLQNNATTPAAVALTIGGNNASTTFSGNLSGPGSLTKTGTGTLTLTGLNTLTGTTTVSGGTLSLQAAATGPLAATGTATIQTGWAEGLTGLYTAIGSGGSTAPLASLEALDTRMNTVNIGQAASSDLRGTFFDFAANGSGFPPPYNSGAANFVGRWTGQFLAETEGLYTFFTASDDGSNLWINGQLVVNNNFGQGVTERFGTVTLAPGWHDITVGYYNGTGGYGLFANYTAPNAAKAPLPNALLRSAPVVASLAGDAGTSLAIGEAGLVVNQATPTTFAGTISATGSPLLTKVGNGNLTLSGATPLSRFFVSPNAASNAPGGLTVAGVVSGSSGLTKTGNGTLLLSNAGNTFAGDVAVTSGWVAATNDGALGDAANRILLNTASGFRGAGNFSTAREIILAPGSTTLNLQATTGSTMTFAGTLSGLSATTQLLKGDGGTIVLASPGPADWTGSINNPTAPTALTGGLRVDQGVVRITDSAALGDVTNIAAVTNQHGAAIELAGGVNLPNQVVLNTTAGSQEAGMWSGFGIGTLVSTSGTNTISGLVNMNTHGGIGAAAGATLNVTGGISLVGDVVAFNGPGTINVSTTPLTGAGGLYKLGSGTTTITTTVAAPTAFGVRNYGGGGTLVFAGDGAVGTNTVEDYIFGGGTIRLDNTATNVVNRLGGASPISIRDGTLEFVASPTAASRESFGQFTVAHGYTNVVVNTTGQNSTLSFDFLPSFNVNGGGTLVFRSAGTGANFGTAANTVAFSYGPRLTPNVLGAGIIQRGLVVDGQGWNFATYAQGSIRAFTAYDTTNLNASSSPATSALSTVEVGSSVNLAANRTINALKLTGGGLTLSGSGSTLTLGSGGILATGGTSTIGAGLVIATGATEVGLNVADGATLNLAAPITTTNIITRGGGGTAVISAPQYSTSWYILTGGTTRLTGGDNTLFPGQGTPGQTQNLSVSPGATLDLNGTAQLVGLFQTSSNNNYDGGGGEITSATPALFATRGTNNDVWLGYRLTGALTNVQAGNGSRFFLSDNTYTGRTAILSNATVLRDAGRFSGTSGIDVNYGGGLYLRDNGQFAIADRVPDAAPIALRGGYLEFQGRSNTISTETLGAVTLAGGVSDINVIVGGTGVNEATLTLADLIPGGGGLNIRQGTTLGLPGSNPRLLITANETAPNAGLVNNILSAAIASDGSNFVSYRVGLGVGKLDQTGYPGYDGTVLPAANAPTQNIRLAAGGTLTLPAGGLALNSLVASQAGTIQFSAATDVLNLTSGGLLRGAAGSLVFGATANSGRITAGGSAPTGTVPLYVHINSGGFTFNAPVVDNGSSPVQLNAILYNAGVLTLAGTNTYTGGTVLNGWLTPGSVSLAATGTIPAGGITLNDATLTQAAGGTIDPTNVVTLNGPAVLTLNGINTLAGLVFNNQGDAGTPTVTTGGTLTLSNTTAITASSMNPQSIATVNGTLDFANGTRTITVNPVAYDGRTFAPFTASLNIGGVIQNAGQITVNGGGVLQVTGQSTFTGGYSVASGSGLNINASSTGAITSGPLGVGTLALADGARLLSGASANSVANAIAPAGTVVFEGLNNLTLAGTVALPATGTFNVVAPQPTLTLSGVVGGTGSALVKTGYGRLNLTGVNTFDGGVTVSRGTLGIGNAAALGTGTLTMTGGALDATVASLTVTNPQSWNGGFGYVGTQALTMSGPVTLAGDSSAGVAANTLTIAGNIGDGGTTRGLTKAGNGILALTGTNIYGGTTTVAAGVLSIGSTAALPGWDTAGRYAATNGGGIAVVNAVSDADVATMIGTGNFAGGGAIGFDTGAGNRTYAPALTGGIGLVKIGANTLTLSGASTLSGPSTVYAGTLTLSNATALQNSVLTMASGSSLVFSSTAGTAFTLGGLNGAANVALLNNAGTPAAIALTVGAANTSTVYSGALTGAGSLIKTGTGTLTLSSTGTNYTGATTINGGTLEIRDATGYTSPTTINAGGTILFTGNANDDIVAAGTMTFNGGTLGFATNGVGTDAYRVFQGGFTVNAAGATLNFDGTRGGGGNNSNVFADGGISGTGPLVINATGVAGTNAGLVLRRGTYAFSGPTTINGGNVWINNNSGAGGSLAFANSDVTLNANGQLRLDVNPSGGASNGSLKSLTGTGTVILGAQTLTLGSNNGSGSFSGLISGTGSVTTTGTGTQTLGGANTFSGTATASAGTLRLANQLAIQNATLDPTSTVQFDASVGSNAFTIAGLTGTGTLALQNNAGSPAAVALTVGNTDRTTSFAGSLTGPGSLAKIGTGTLTLSGTNSFTGGATVSTGTLVAGSTASLPGFADPGRNTVAVGATLAFGNDFADADIPATLLATTLPAGSFFGFDTSAGNRTSAANLTDDSGLRKIGANTLTLSGTNTYTGPTFVSAGTLTLAATTALPGWNVAGSANVEAAAVLAVANTITDADFATVRTNATVAATGFVGFDTTVGNRTSAAVIDGAKGFAAVGPNTLSLSSPIAAGYTGPTFIATGSTLLLTSDTNQALSGVVSGPGTLRKQGAGTLTLSGANTFTGTVRPETGRLSLANVNALQSAILDMGTYGAQQVTFDAPGLNTYAVGALTGVNELAFGGNSLALGGGNQSGTYTGVVSGTGNVTKNGTGTQAFEGSASNTYVGTTTVVAGALSLNKSGGAVALGNELIFNNATSPDVYTFQNNQFAPGTVVSFTNDNTEHGRLELMGTVQTVAGVRTVGYTTIRGVIQNREVGPTNNGISTLVLDGVGSYAFGGYLRNQVGTLGVNKTGTGTQTFAGTAITYTGPTNVSAGTLILQNTNNNTTQTFASPIQVNAAATLQAERTTAGLAGRGPQLGNAVAGLGTLTINNAANGAGNTAGGWTIFQVANGLVWSGTININSGVFSRDNSNADTINGSAIVNVASNAVFGAGRGGNSIIGSLNGAGAVSTAWSGTNAGSITIGSGNRSGTFTGTLNGSGGTTDGNLDGGVLSVIKIGTGTQVFAGSAASPYTGATRVLGGVLEYDFANMATPTNLVSASSALQIGGGTLRIKGKATGSTAQTVNGLTLQAGGGGLLVNPNGGTGSTVTLGGLTAAAAGSSALLGKAPAAGAGTVTITTTTALPGTGVYSPRVVFTDGTAFNWATTATATPFVLSGLGTYAALDTVAGTDTLNSRITADTVLAGSRTTNTLKVENPAAAQSLAIGAGNTLTLTGGGLLVTGTQDFAVNAGSLTAGNGNGAFDLVAHNYSTGTLTIGSAIANNGANATQFTSAGTGRTVLTGTSTYTGATNIGNGTLALSGTMASTAYNIGSGTLQPTTSGAMPVGSTVTVTGGVFDLNGLNRTISNIGVGGYGGVITDNSAGAGTTTLSLSAFTTGSVVTRITDGPSKQVAVAVVNNNNTPSLINGLSSFSGGFVLKHGGAIGTRVQIGSQIATIGPPGAIVSSPFGTGAITIGETATDRAAFFVSQANVRIFNDVVFNTALGNERPAAFRVDAGGFELAGTLTGNLAPVNLSGNSGNATVLLSGRITGTQGLRLIRNSFATGNALSVTLRNLGATANDYGGPTAIENPHVLILGAAGQIPDGEGKGDVTVDGTLNLAGYSETINGLSGSGIVDSGWGFNPVVLTVGANDAGGSFTGTLRNTAGTLGLVKVGAGTLALSGTNTYVGGTTLGGGRLEVGSAGAIGTTGAITFAGGTLAYTGATTDFSPRFVQAAGTAYNVDVDGGDVTWATGLTSTGSSLRKGGFGTLVLGAANTFSAGATLAGGSLELGAAGALGASGQISFSGGRLRYSAADATDYSARFSTAAGQQVAVDTNSQSVTFASPLTSDGGSLAKSGLGTLTLAGANTYSSGTMVSGGTLAIGSGGTAGSVGPGSVDVGFGGTLAFNRSDDYGGAFTSTIFGAGDVRLELGSLTLSGLNSYSGSTTVAGGTLRATNAQALGQSFSTNALALAGGRLELAGDTATVFGPFGLGFGTSVSANTTIVSDRLTAGAGVTQELGTLAMGGQTLTIARGANVTSGTATIAFGGEATFSADPTIVTNAGAQLVFAGGIGGSLASLTKNGPGLLTLTGTGHAGSYAINAGTLRIGNGGTSGSLAAATGVTLASGALLAFDRTDNYGSAVSMPITGAGGLSLAAGTLALAGSNAYTGGTAVNGGRLIATLADVLGQGDVAIASGGVLQLDVSPLLGAGNAIATSPGGGLVYASGVSAPLEALSSLAGWQILPSASRLSTASMLYGTVPAGGTTLAASWLAGDPSQYSDILALSGTGAGNPFVLSMAYDPAIDSSLLEILNIGRRPGSSGPFASIGTSFQGVGVPWTSAFVTPGQYGVDTTTSTVWVVSDTNSQFVVVPEPATLALAAAAGLAGLALLRRRRG